MFRSLAAQQPVQKTNPMKVYMHYMPWFETPETIGGWGWHWTMNTMDPENIDPDGHREIASHYYPLIGPYASRDKDVIEYHLLLMKLSGIDGVLIDWYGTVGSNGDVKDLLKSSDSIVSCTDDFGLRFAVVMEDRFSRSINDVKANMTYLKNNYFNRPEYIRVGVNEDPLVCIFGPITFQDPADWDDIMPSAGEEVEFLTLWYQSGEAGSNADGEYMWVYQDEQSHLTHLTNFYTIRAPQLKTVMGSAYPGFNDFYEEGGAGSGYFTIPHYYGSTLTETLNRADQYKDDLDMVQLVTFNDFGEGTMIEPTVETGFDYLVRVQDYTGVEYGETELQLVHRLFRLRKDYAADSEVQDSLNQASVHLRNLEINQAALILNAIEPITGTPGLNRGNVKPDKLMVYPNPYSGGKLNLEVPGNPAEIIRITIMDMTGRVLFESWPEAGSASFSFVNPRLPDGIYMISLHGERTVSSTKFMVTR